MSTYRYVIQVALPLPLYRNFDYDSDVLPAVGARLRVPFGNLQLFGICVGETAQPDPRFARKPIIEIVDQQSVWPPALWRLLHWAADYYQHPLGEVLHHGLPVLARQGELLSYQATERYEVTPQGAALALS